MLSRVANKLFWTGRYLERSEDTSRLLISFSNLIVDLPENNEVRWDILIRIFNCQKLFSERMRDISEYNIMKFLISDQKNLSSIVNTISFVRENVRTTRDALPYEMWEYVSELYHFVNEGASKSHNRKNRFEYLDQIITRSQQINGMLGMTLSRDHAHKFIRLGRLIERADMVSRVVDVGVNLLKNDEANKQAGLLLDQHLWTSILKALSCLSSYRQYIGPTANTNDVIKFVFKETTNPRSIIFCVKGVFEELKTLDRNTIPVESIIKIIEAIYQFDPNPKNINSIHKFIDNFQKSLGILNDEISQNWFMVENRNINLNNIVQ